MQRLRRNVYFYCRRAGVLSAERLYKSTHKMSRMPQSQKSSKKQFQFRQSLKKKRPERDAFKIYFYSTTTIISVEILAYSLTERGYSPVSFIGAFRSMSFLSIFSPAEFNASAISYAVMLPKILPCSPCLAFKTIFLPLSCAAFSIAARRSCSLW